MELVRCVDKRLDKTRKNYKKILRFTYESEN